MRRYFVLVSCVMVSACSSGPNEESVKAMISRSPKDVAIDKIKCTEQMNEEYVCFVAWTAYGSRWQADDARFHKVGDGWTSDLHDRSIFIGPAN